MTGKSGFLSMLSRSWNDGNLKPIILLVSISFFFNLAFSLARFYDWNFDSWSHMFFASHYMTSWFDTWDIRWFGGISVTSYPPLATQILAVGGYIFGLETAYSLFTLVLMAIWPLAVYSFSKCFLPPQQAFWAGALAIVLPSIYLANYAYGQLPTLFALITALLMASYFWRYMTTRRLLDGLMAAIFLGITAAAHQFTFICFVPFLLLSLTLTLVSNKLANIRSIIKPLVIFIGLSLITALLPILPFWKFLLSATPQTAIPHISRTNFFSNGTAFIQLFIAPYLLLLLCIPLVIFHSIKFKKNIPILVLFCFLFVLGLGGTTPLPRFVFFQWWNWLTYDRFTIWAGAILLVLVAARIEVNPGKLTMSSFKPLSVAVLAFIFIALSIGGALFGSRPSRISFLSSPNIIETAYFTDFLASQNPNLQYRYITLGFGEANCQRLAVKTKSSSLDGGYFTARTLPILTQSGIGMLDTSKFVDPQLTTLRELLLRADEYGLKWVFSNDIYYDNVLKDSGFILRWNSIIAQDNRLGGVNIWIKQNVSPIGIQKHETGFLSYIWGIAPLSLTFLLLILFSISLIEKAKKEIPSSGIPD
jgi:hypothetical protein